MNRVLVVAPHPDDETLGCGGTLLKHKANSDYVHWLIVTDMSTENGFTAEQVITRTDEINEVAKRYGFDGWDNLRFPPARLDTVPAAELVAKIGAIVHKVQPNILYLPYRGDVHSDHKFVFDATAACTKWFRYPSIEKVLIYETLSETEFGINPDSNGFRPNVYHNIEGFLEQKISIMMCYKSEVSAFPFPRSEKAMRALAEYRGVAAGCQTAEAFMLIKEIVK